jgi:hypothetical protein
LYASGTFCSHKVLSGGRFGRIFCRKQGMIMDAFSVADALQMTSMQGSSMAASPIKAPAELVSRFEQMMQQTPAPADGISINGVSTSPLAAALINRVEQHISGHVQVIERAASIDPASMSAAEIDKINIETVVQMGLLSMNQSAFLEVLGSTKSAVSSLMKNQ